MTIYVTRSKQRGKGCIKPEALNPAFTDGENLNYLISRNPDCIYYSDDPVADLFGAGEVVTRADVLVIQTNCGDQDDWYDYEVLEYPDNEFDARARVQRLNDGGVEGWRYRLVQRVTATTTTVLR